jgi:hypothetical protein
MPNARSQVIIQPKVLEEDLQFMLDEIDRLGSDLWKRLVCLLEEEVEEEEEKEEEEKANEVNELDAERAA